MFVDLPIICVILPYIPTCSWIVRCRIISGMWGCMQEWISCTSLEGQKTIGLIRFGFEGVPIQWRGREGPATNRVGSYMWKNIVWRMKWDINERWFGMAARKMHGKQMQFKESNGDKIWGDKERHLGFGEVIGGTIGTMGASMGACGTNRIFASLDKGGRINAYRAGNWSRTSLREEECSRLGGGVAIRSFHAEKPARPTTNEFIVPRR